MSAKPPREIRPWRMLLFAAALGTVLGPLMYVYQSYREAQALAAFKKAQIPGVPKLQSPKRFVAPVVDPKALDGIPPYPNAAPGPILSQPEGVGGELKLGWFATADSVDEVIEFYKRAFDAEKRNMVVHRFKGPDGTNTTGYVGWFEEGDEKKPLHLVAVARSGNQTLVFPSNSKPELMVDRRNADDQGGLPKLPTATRTVSFAIDETGARAYFATASDATVADVVSFYKDALPKEGWSVTEAVLESESVGRVDASRQRQSAQVSIEARPNREVAISITIVGSSA